MADLYKCTSCTNTRRVDPDPDKWILGSFWDIRCPRCGAEMTVQRDPDEWEWVGNQGWVRRR